MAEAITGITSYINTGAGTWLDIAGGQGSSESTIAFVSGTSSRARKFSGTKGMLYQINAAGEDLTNIALQLRFQLVGGFAATTASGGAVLRVQDTSGNFKDFNVTGSDRYTGGWQIVSIKPTQTASSASGTLDVTLVEYVGLVVNANGGSGGDPNFYIDQVLGYNTGNGISYANSLQAETQPIEYLYEQDGISLQELVPERSGVGFSLASVRISGVGFPVTSTDEVLVLEDPIYYQTSDFSATQVDHDFTVSATTGAVNLTRLAATAYTNPGAVTGSSNKTLDFSTYDSGTCSTSTFTGFTNGGTLGASSILDTTFIGCGIIALGTGTYERNIFRSSTGTAAISTDSLSKINEFIFSDDSGHAIQLDTSNTGDTASWDSSATGYDTGSFGNGVEVTGGSITGNETINVLDTSGTIDISVVSGSAPSVASAGATVNITGFQPTLTLTNLVANSEIRIYPSTGEQTTISFSGNSISISAGDFTKLGLTNGDKILVRSPLNTGTYTVNSFTTTSIDCSPTTFTTESAGELMSIVNADNELTGVENSGTSFDYQYNYAVDSFVDIVVHNVEYEHFRQRNFELGDQNATLPVAQQFDRNFFDEPAPYLLVEGTWNNLLPGGGSHTNTVTFKNDGTLEQTGAGGTLTGRTPAVTAGEWTNSTGAADTNYEFRFTNLSLTGSPVFSAIKGTGLAEDTWYTFDNTDIVFSETNFATSVTNIATFTFEVRKVSDQTVVLSEAQTLQTIPNA